MCLKKFIAEKLVRPFKSCGVFGHQRFWILYWAYRVTGWHIRHKEWDFVMEYLPSLMKGQQVSVLDVGCSRNLLAYEIVGRGYSLAGIDLEPYQEIYPGLFFKCDVRNLDYLQRKFDFITCISVLEHIEFGQDIALQKMIEALEVGGRLLLTIPTKEFAQGHPWYGFDLEKISGLLPDRAEILEYTERAGQLCLSIVRLP